MVIELKPLRDDTAGIFPQGNIYGCDHATAFFKFQHIYTEPADGRRVTAPPDSIMRGWFVRNYTVRQPADPRPLEPFRFRPSAPRVQGDSRRAGQGGSERGAARSNRRRARSRRGWRSTRGTRARSTRCGRRLCRGPLRGARPPPPPRTKWTRRVPRPVLIGHAASLNPY